MFCPKCGTKNEDTARFCMKCGAQLVSIEQPRQAPPAPTAKPKRRPRSGLRVAAAVVVLLVIVRKALEAYFAGDYATAENYGLIPDDIRVGGKPTEIEIRDVKITGDTARVNVTIWYGERWYGNIVYISFRLYKREGRWVIKDVW